MNKPTRILIVEDMAADADLAIHTVRKVLKDCEFKVVETRQDFLQALEVFQPDMILSDYSLPHFDGRQALQLALQHAPLTPLIIWTGSISEDVAVDCMKAGANNYVIKENLKRLGPAVIHALEEKESRMARRQAEEALQNSEKRFRALIENGLENISLLKADGTLIWESPATVRMLEYAPDEFVKRNIFELVHPDDLAFTRESYGKLLQEPGGRQSGVFRLRHSDGTWRWAEAIATNMLDEPSVNAIVINYRDITGRKQAEEALHHSLEETKRGQHLLLRLSEVGRVIQRAHSAEAVYRAICEGLSSLGYRVSIFSLTEDKRHLTIAHTTLSLKLINAVEKVTGFSIWNYRFPLLDENFLKKAFYKNEATLTIPDEAEIAKLLPLPLQPLARRILTLIDIHSIISTPIMVGDEPHGLLVVDGPELTGFDTLPIATFAAQASIALENAQLYESVQQELYERKQAEARLNDLLAFNEKILNHSLVGILTYKLTGECIYANEDAAAIVGTRVEQLLTQNFHTIAAWKNSGLYNLVQRAITTLAPVTADIHHVSTFGKDTWLTVHCVTFKSKDEDHVLLSVSDITERKQAEEALRESKNRLILALFGAQMSVWEWDLQTDQILWSPEFFEITGVREDEFDGTFEAFTHLIHSNDVERVIASARKTINERTLFAEEFRITRPDGEIRWLSNLGQAEYDATGNHLRLIGTVQDITRRKQAEKMLQESEERFSSAFEYASIGMALLTPTGQWFRVNRALCNLTGYSEAELLKKTFQDITHPDDLESDLKQVRQLLLGEINSYQMEKRYFHKFGQVIWILLSVSLVRDNEGKPLYLVSQIQDITERKRAESALLESITQFRTLFEASPEAILLIDPNDNWSILDCNTAACQMNGYSRAELIGQSIDILNTTPGNPNERADYMERIRQHTTLRYETAHRRKDGNVIIVEVSTSLIRFGKRDIVLGIDRDITQRKQSEVAVDRHMAELEALYENGLAVGRLLKPGEIGNRVIETFARYLPWHHVTIRLRQEESDDLKLVAFNLPNLRDEKRAETEQHFIARINKVGQGLSGWVIQTGLPLRTGNVHVHPQYIDTHAGIQSGLYMPLKVGERVIGVISVESEEPDAFTEKDERLLATLANQAAIAFENARLYETVQKELAERKRAEEALRASETHYRELADSITDILFELDQDLHYTHWNKTSEAVTGITVDNAIGRSMLEIFGETEEQVRIGKIYEDVLKKRQPRTFETSAVIKKEKRSLEVNAYPSTRGVSVVAKDVTDRKRSETIMQKRFELMEYSAGHTLRELMQKTTDEVSELTGSTIGFFHSVQADQNTLGIQTWSTNALRLFNVPASEGTHLPLDQAGVWAEAVHQRRPLIQNDYESLARKKGLPQGHVPILREIVIPILRNERIVGVMGIGNKPQEYTQYDLEIAERLADYAWDITERKQMEEMLADERNQLAQRVEERTADLSRANSNLARALRVKDEFLANMSHELRTPLNAILGLSESLGEQIAGPLNEKQQKYTTTISESGHHLLSLINDILDLAKIDAGQITLDINKVDVHSVCQASLRMIKQLAQKKNQEVTLEIDPGLEVMWADERRLKQMIVNLLGNAVKFTPESGKLGLEVHAEEGANKITITVWDTGIGIREKDLARLFQPFVQLDAGLAREATGTGLGLALVAQMARLHGGSVSAVSEPEKGSRFSIILPWEPSLVMDAAARMRITGKFRAIKPDNINKPTILLVEDTQEVTMMIRDYLELAGYKVVTAQDGVDALVQARLARPDLILMDVQMPRMDGLEATRKLRNDPDFRYTPIIALTALAMSSDRERCLAAGMDEYLSKPINLKALVKVIQDCLFDREESKPK